MLKPYICVVCEKVIIAADGVPSLIGLFNKVAVTAPAEAEIPKNALAPKEWAVFSMWITEPGDELKEYIICTQILYPDQSQFAEVAKSKLTIERDKRQSQMRVQWVGFPIGQVGEYTVRTWIEENQQRILGPFEIKIDLEKTKQAQPQRAP